jgi:hypothetical protein
VRESDGALLAADGLAEGGDGFVAWDEGRGTVLRYDLAARAYDKPPLRLALSGSFVISGRDGPIACRPAFDLYAARCHAMSPESAARLSGVDAAAIRAAAQLLWQHRPVAHLTWTGLAADICIYGGAAGGGKTIGLIPEPLHHVGRIAKFTAVFFRRTTPGSPLPERYGMTA